VRPCKLTSREGGSISNSHRFFVYKDYSFKDYPIYMLAIHRLVFWISYLVNRKYPDSRKFVIFWIIQRPNWSTSMEGLAYKFNTTSNRFHLDKGWFWNISATKCRPFRRPQSSTFFLRPGLINSCGNFQPLLGRDYSSPLIHSGLFKGEFSPSGRC